VEDFVAMIIHSGVYSKLESVKRSNGKEEMVNQKKGDFIDL